MDKTEKKILRNNVIKFIIGIILLGFSWGYIINHPAEKESIFSGFQVLRQRIVVYVHTVINIDPESFQKKYDYERTYEELINMAESKNCVDENVLAEINETLLKLKKEGVRTLNENLPGYVRKANEYKHIIDTCASK